MRTILASRRSYGLVSAAAIAAFVIAFVVNTRLGKINWQWNGFAENAEATEADALDSANLGFFTINLANSRKVVQLEASIKLDQNSFKEQLLTPGFPRLSGRTLERRGKLEAVWSSGFKSRRKGAAEVPPYLELYMGRLRDSMIGSLSSKHSADLTEGAERELLQEGLLEDLNSALGVHHAVIQEVTLKDVNLKESASFRLSE